MKRSAWAWIGMIALTGAVAAQDTPPPATGPHQQIAASDEVIAAYVDGQLSDAVERSGLPGAAILLFHENRRILAKGYGWADLAARRPVTPDATVFRQGSIAKLFTWLMAMQLVDAGRLQLDRDVSSYLGFALPASGGEPITLQHLMTHSAGFAERVNGIFDSDLNEPLCSRLQRNVPARPYAPGEVVAYSNYGAALTACIVERVVGTPFDALVEKQIFHPVGMVESTFAQPLPAALEQLRAQDYSPGSRVPLPFTIVAAAPAGALSATPVDMGRFLQMLLAGGQGPNGRVIAPATLDRMMQLQRPLAPGLDAGFGLGFHVHEFRGVRVVGHGGTLNGTFSDLRLLPDHGIGWYLVLNGSGPQRGAARRLREDLARAIVSRFIAPDAVAPPTVASPPAADLAGVYFSTRRSVASFRTLGELRAPIIVSVAPDAALSVSIAKRADGSARRFLPVAHDRYADEDTGMALVAERGADGRVVRLAGLPATDNSELERVSNFVLWIPGLLKLSLALLVPAALAWPIGRIQQWRLRTPAPSVSRTPLTLVAARVGAATILLAAYGWFAFFTELDSNLSLAIASNPWRMTLVALTILAVAGAAAMLIDAIAAWRDPGRGILRPIGAAAAAAGALFLAWLALQHDLTWFGSDF